MSFQAEIALSRWNTRHYYYQIQTDPVRLWYQRQMRTKLQPNLLEMVMS